MWGRLKKMPVFLLVAPIPKELTINRLRVVANKHLEDGMTFNFSGHSG
jgi:hypothetical protein